MYCGTAYRNKGVQLPLDAVVDFPLTRLMWARCTVRQMGDESW